MTYSEFVKIYPALDLFLELFKGLGPTLIAILAIVLNHRNSVKRDKENRRNSLYYTVQKEMLDKFLELSQLQWKCGANLIDLLSKQDAGRGEDIQEIYSPVLYNMQFKAQEIKDYYHSMLKGKEYERWSSTYNAIAKTSVSRGKSEENSAGKDSGTSSK